MEEDQIFYEPIDPDRQIDRDFGQWPFKLNSGNISGDRLPTIEW
ncbi:hypothetical protein [Oricola indica]